jgi:hypothetical protein
MSKKIRRQLPIAIGFVLSCIWLFIINVNYSRDFNNYRALYERSYNLSLIDRITSINFAYDPSFFILQSFSSAFIPFEVFVFGVVLICLSLKLTALLEIRPEPTILDVMPYFLILSFLHEGTQLRIALAISVAFWSLVFFAKNRRLLACLTLLMACTFHISAAVFFAVYLIYITYTRFGIWSYICMGILGGLLLHFAVIPNLTLHLGELTNARYMNYAQGMLARRQNSTGLFQYYFLFVALITFLIKVFYKPSTDLWRNLQNLAIGSGLFAVIILQIFNFNVVIASRLADILSFPIAIVLGATLVQLKNEKRFIILYFTIAILIVYCLGRGYATFRPGNLDHSPCIVTQGETAAPSVACVDFTSKEVPSSITKINGLSENESWGRWSDARMGSIKFIFKDKLPRNFILEIQATTFGPNKGGNVLVTAGSAEKYFLLNNNEGVSNYIIKFTNVDADSIEIFPPKPTSPKSLGIGDDNRQLGIGFISLMID